MLTLPVAMLWSNGGEEDEECGGWLACCADAFNKRKERKNRSSGADEDAAVPKLYTSHLMLRLCGAQSRAGLGLGLASRLLA